MVLRNHRESLVGGGSGSGAHCNQKVSASLGLRGGIGPAVLQPCSGLLLLNPVVLPLVGAAEIRVIAL